MALFAKPSLDYGSEFELNVYFVLGSSIGLMGSRSLGRLHMVKMNDAAADRNVLWFPSGINAV